MKCYVIRYCKSCGCDTVHIPTTLSLVLDHVLKILTRWTWASDRTPTRYTCSACEMRQVVDERSRLGRLSG